MEFRFFDGDDWKGLYVDGHLVAEGHEVTLERLAHAAGLNFKRVYLEGEAAERLGNEGNFPAKQSDWSELND